MKDRDCKLRKKYEVWIIFLNNKLLKYCECDSSFFKNRIVKINVSC